MRIEHLAIWCHDIENVRSFYERYLGGVSGNKYHNEVKNFQSYFLTFESGCRLELMQIPELKQRPDDANAPFTGIAHFAMSVGSKDAVDKLTTQLRQDGFAIVGEPRTTGDGYYESVVLDPEGNRVEITV